MPSHLDNLAARDFAAGHREVMQTVIRRIGGQEDRAEEVEAVVELDAKLAADRGGVIDSERGQYLDFGGLMEVSATQATTEYDKWVIDGEVYHQLGGPIGKDGATKTIVLLKRKGMKGGEPRTSGRRR